MPIKPTWKPCTEHGKLTRQSDLPDSVFAFPKQRKEPLTDASHVRNALARFDQVQGVFGQDRDSAFANIKKAAENYGVEVHETTDLLGQRWAFRSQAIFFRRISVEDNGYFHAAHIITCWNPA